MAAAAPLALHEGDRGRLEALARSASARPSLVQRARIVLMSAEGLTNTEIARRTGATRPTVVNWRNRYATGGINALGDLPRPGRPPVVDELEVVATTLANGGHPPAHLGADQWSSRLLAQQLGISFATVSRIWRKWGIQPDHVETFTFANDLQRQAQVRDLSGLYRNLSRRAAALHRQEPHDEGKPAGQPDPWHKLVEVSFGIITQQAIRRGTFASVRNLIDALASLTDGWQDRQDTPKQDDTDEGGAAAAAALSRFRQIISDTPGELRRGSSRSAESVGSWSPGRQASTAPGTEARETTPQETTPQETTPQETTARETTARETKPVRAEFHGARGRRSRPTGRTGS